MNWVRGKALIGGEEWRVILRYAQNDRERGKAFLAAEVWGEYMMFA